jgi:hypothetical protein
MRTETQLFIVLFILVILFCLAYNQEGFAVSSDDNTIKQIASFLQLSSNELNQNNQPGTPEEKKDYKAILDEITKLNSSLQIMIQQNNTIASIQSSQVSQPDNLDQINDVKATQIIQDKYINELKTRLAKLQQIYGGYLQKKTEQVVKYDKIPVYSSCIVSEADGKYTITPSPKI